jgi:hypothetical protein
MCVFFSSQQLTNSAFLSFSCLLDIGESGAVSLSSSGCGLSARTSSPSVMAARAPHGGARNDNQCVPPCGSNFETKNLQSFEKINEFSNQGRKFVCCPRSSRLPSLVTTARERASEREACVHCSNAHPRDLRAAMLASQSGRGIASPPVVVGDGVHGLQTASKRGVGHSSTIVASPVKVLDKSDLDQLGPEDRIAVMNMVKEVMHARWRRVRLSHPNVPRLNVRACVCACLFTFALSPLRQSCPSFSSGNASYLFVTTITGHKLTASSSALPPSCNLTRTTHGHDRPRLPHQGEVSVDEAVSKVKAEVDFKRAARAGKVCESSPYLAPTTMNVLVREGALLWGG